MIENLFKFKCKNLNRYKNNKYNTKHFMVSISILKSLKVN
jgi:hypothetical protein